MRIAVVGGAGFVGAHLVSALLHQAHDVLVFDNLFCGRRRQDLAWLNQVQFCQADITDGCRLAADLHSFRPEIAVHLAALHYIPYCDQHPAETLRVNVEGTLNVMLAATQIPGLKGVLYASSVAVYPPTDRCHEETDPPGPCDIYGLSKWLGEQIVEQYARQAQIAHLSLRFSNLYGPAETNSHVIPAVLGQLWEEDSTLRLGRTDTCRDFLYIEDLVRALTAAISLVAYEEVHGVLNLGPGKEWSVGEVVEVLGELSGRRLRVACDPGRVRNVDRLHLRANIERARKLLGWGPSCDLRAGLAKVYAAEAQGRARAAAACI
jgi:UDP-glucose 4-epimerase